MTFLRISIPPGGVLQTCLRRSAGRLATALVRHRGTGSTRDRRHHAQLLLNETAEAMLRGELDLALIVGAERSQRRVRQKGRRAAAWSYRQSSPFPWTPPHPPRRPTSNAGLGTFPLWDTARRARRGASLTRTPPKRPP